jgi:uncharacterized membrane protein
MIIIKWFLLFIVYSFIGWLYESVLCSISERKLINRGFLNGPVCPVYGFGALTVLAILDGRTDSVVVLFLAASILTCTLEYLTSYLLEKLFNAKWWDYSNRRFNLNGRVCLEGALVFGVMSVLLIRFIHPFITGLVSRMPSTVMIPVSALLFVVFILDTVFTVNHVAALNGRLGEIQAAINNFVEQHMKRAEELKNSLVENFEQSEYYNERIKSLLTLSRFQNMRLVRAFPKLRSVKYEEAMKKLKESLQHKRYKDK